jgi:deazaflavin-dependent oxidoreductase (nitroreductase family)
VSALPYVDPRAPRGALYRLYVKFLGTPLAAWISKHVVWRVDPLLMRMTGGRLGMGLMVPTALLETRGARTGQVRRSGVIYFNDGDCITIVASKLGLPEHPSWFHNLRANPDVLLAGKPFRAEMVEDDAERTRLWALADQLFPPYATYRKRAESVGRTIPIVQLIAR